MRAPRPHACGTDAALRGCPGRPGVSLSYRRAYRTGTWYGTLWLFKLYDRVSLLLLSLTSGGLTSGLIWRYRRSPGRRGLSFDHLDDALTRIVALLMALVACCLPFMLWTF